MPKNTLTIATRQSQLALWQANWVKKQLQHHHPKLTITLLPLSTRGDQILDQSLTKIGGKGLFIKELEYALLENRADIAVHSMKDVPMDLPNNLALPVICKRHTPCDVLLSKRYRDIRELPKNTVVGTSSLRRQSQLLRQNPNVITKPLRGNVNTRIDKLNRDEFDAIILAQAGIDRLNLGKEMATPLSLENFLPAAGQGALGIECRANDMQTRDLIRVLHDEISSICILAERAMVRFLQGSCQVPIAALAQVENNKISLHGLVGEIDGSIIIKKYACAEKKKAESLGISLAKDLLSAGADKILEKYR